MKVPFEEVPELVASRKVYIHQGNAYVAMNQVTHDVLQFFICHITVNLVRLLDGSTMLFFCPQVVSLVVTQFRSFLSKALILTNR